MVEVSLYGDRLFIIFVKTSDRFLVKKIEGKVQRYILYFSQRLCHIEFF